jgi:hypothetical protein
VGGVITDSPQRAQQSLASRSLPVR